jgi:hypothetical protein
MLRKLMHPPRISKVGIPKSFVQGLITFTIVTPIIIYLSKQAGKTKAAVVDNRFELRLPKLYLWLGWVSTTIGCAALLIPILDSGNETATWGIAILFLAMFGGLGSCLLLYYYNHFIAYNGRNIIISNRRKQQTTTAWESLTNIEFTPLSGCLKVQTKKKWFNVSSHFVGVRAFLNELEVRTELDASKLKLPF